MDESGFISKSRKDDFCLYCILCRCDVAASSKGINSRGFTHVCSFIHIFIFFDTIRHLQFKHNIWQNTLIWQKNKKNQTLLIDSLTFSVTWQKKKKRSIFMFSHTRRFHLTWLYSVFYEDSSKNHGQVRQYPETS